jgi:branched-chain amino acid transport system ATP-binding protein
MPERQPAAGQGAPQAPGGGDLLSVVDVAKRFGGVWAVGGVSFRVAPASIHGLIGPNGAGKTTVLNLISGVYYVDRGRVALEGREITRLPLHRRSPAGVARTFQSPQLFREMSVAENVALGGFPHMPSGFVAGLLRGWRYHESELAASAEAGRWLEFTELDGVADRVAGDLSYGLQKLVEVARALAGGPRLLLLDEPAAGLNPEEIERLKRLIRRIAAAGIGVLLVEHNMRLVMDICEELTVLNFGQVIARGAPEQVRADRQVIEAYLGRRHRAPA